MYSSPCDCTSGIGNDLYCVEAGAPKPVELYGKVKAPEDRDDNDNESVGMAVN